MRSRMLVVLLAGVGYVGCTTDEDNDNDAEEIVLTGDVVGAAIDPGTDNSLEEDPADVDPVANEADEDLRARADLADVPEPSDVAEIASVPAVHCTRHVAVTLISYTAMGKPTTNGCWTYERPRQEPDDWHICHFDRDSTHGTSRWFYDDVNPFYHSRHELITRIHECGFAVAHRGYELLAPHGDAWRLIATKLASLYYAELYTDNDHIDNAWSSYRYSQTLRNARRRYHISPMVNIGTGDALSTIRAEVYKICRRVKSGRHFGIYAESGHPIGVVGGPHHSIARMHMLEQALDACTTR